MRRLRHVVLSAALIPLAACYAPASLQMPSYEPRAVAVPPECDALTQRAAASGAASLNETEFRTLTFCQNQQIIRAQEEEAAARRLEAHSRTASFVLQAATVVVGATIAVLTWVF